jgi:hypothetical protein
VKSKKKLAADQKRNKISTQIKLIKSRKKRPVRRHFQKFRTQKGKVTSCPYQNRNKNIGPQKDLPQQIEK